MRFRWTSRGSGGARGSAVIEGGERDAVLWAHLRPVGERWRLRVWGSGLGGVAPDYEVRSTVHRREDLARAEADRYAAEVRRGLLERRLAALDAERAEVARELGA